MNKTDFSVYCLMLLIADHRTGVWWGSAKALAAYNFARSTARNSLQRLESKGYIKRFPTPGVHSNYPILLNKYAITDGQHKGQLLDAQHTTSYQSPAYVGQQKGEHLGQQVGQHPAPIQEERIKKKEKRKNTHPSGSLAFDDFWNAYPRKVGKPSAQKAWKKIPPRTRYDNLMAGLERWKQTDQWQTETLIPHPATFLNDRRWENTPPARSTGSADAAVGRGPQPKTTQPLPPEAQKRLARKTRLDRIASLERFLRPGHGTTDSRKRAQEELEKLRGKK